MIKRPENIRTQVRLIAAACVFCIICMVPGILSARYQLLSDDIYQILNCRYPRQTPMAPLTAALGYLFTLMTDRLLHFRYLTLALNYGAVLCMTGWLIKRRAGNAAGLLVAAGVSLWMCGILPIRSWIFGWDGFSTLFLTLTLISTLSLRRQPSWKNLTLCALAASCATLSRIPNVIVIFLICPYIIWVCRGNGLDIKETCKRTGFYLLTSLLAVAVFLMIMYGSPDAYLAAWKENTLSRHSLTDCFSYLPYIKRLFGVLSQLIVLYLAFDFLTSGKSKRLMRVCLTALLAWFMWELLKNNLDVREINFYANGFVIASMIGVFIYRRERDVRISLLMTAAIMYAASFGSNCGLIKIMIIPVMPLLYSWLRPKWHRGMTVFIVLFIVILSYKTFVNLKYKESFEAPLKDMVEFREIREFQGIHTQPRIVELMERIRRDIEPYSRRGYRVKVLSTDFIRFSFEMIFNDHNPVLAHYWSIWPNEAPTDQFFNYVRRVAQSKEPTVVLCINEISVNSYQPAKLREEEWMQILKDSMRPMPTSADGYSIYINR